MSADPGFLERYQRKTKAAREAMQAAFSSTVDRPAPEPFWSPGERFKNRMRVRRAIEGERRRLGRALNGADHGRLAKNLGLPVREYRRLRDE